MLRERDTQAMDADFPVQRRGRRQRLEVREERDADFESGEFRGGDGVEAGVVQGAAFLTSVVCANGGLAGERGRERGNRCTHDVSA